MNFIAGGLNGKYLKDILYNSIGKTNNVKIAVAYASGDHEIFNFCFNNNIRLTFWGRYDESTPVTLNILEPFLKRRSANYVCKLIPDIFHAKIIWWEGYGVYIGSANLTDRAWNNNIEAGIFLKDEEIVDSELEDELINYFKEIDKKSTPLTTEIFNELKALENRRKDIDKQKKNFRDDFQKSRLIPKLAGLLYANTDTVNEKRRKAFLKEWYETIEILRKIASFVSSDKYRPAWILEKTPSGVQADQFLHAYYYSQVKQGTRAFHHELFEQNKNNPDKTLHNALEWWRKLQTAPHDEDIMINSWAPFLEKMLAKDNLVSLSMDDFLNICKKVHALREHSLRAKHTSLGYYKPLPKMDSEKRITLLGNWLYEKRSEKGKTVLETIQHVLYGGKHEKLPERLWESTQSDIWKIPHLGISSLGEITGWAMPDIFPPRNGRTSKALTALGYAVTIHSE